MTRWRKFRRMPIMAKAILVIFTPFAFLEIVLASLWAIIDSVAKFWTNAEKEEP